MNYALEMEDVEATELVSCYLEDTLVLETGVAPFNHHRPISIPVQDSTKPSSKHDIILDHDLEGHINNLTFKQLCILYRFWEMILSFSERLEKTTCTMEVVELFRRHIRIPEMWSNIGKKKRSSSTLSLPTFENLFVSELEEGKGMSATESVPSLGIMENTEKTVATSRHHISVLEELWLGMLGNFAESDVSLLRFLRARKWSLDEAFKMFIECLHWRWSKEVLSLMRRGETSMPSHLLASGKAFFHGTDKSGHLMIFILSRKHDKRALTEEENENFTIYHMELARRLLGKGMERSTIIFDLNDAGYSSLDISSIKHMISCFQNNYPESLHRCYVLNAPWIFWALWKLISPLLDPVVAAKITFVKRTEDLLTYIDEANIPSTVLSKVKTKEENALASFSSTRINDVDKGQKPSGEQMVHEYYLDDEALAASLALLKEKTLNISSILKSCSERDFEGQLGELISQRRILVDEYKRYASGSLLRSYAKNVYEKFGILDHDDYEYLSWKKTLHLKGEIPS